jgi:hypothetical protein
VLESFLKSLIKPLMELESIWNSLTDLNSLRTSGKSCLLSRRLVSCKLSTDLEMSLYQILLIISLVEIVADSSSNLKEGT